MTLIRPEKTTIVGLCRVIPQEHQNMRCRVVDIGHLSKPDPGESWLAEQLASELTAIVGDVVVAYRESVRYVQRFTPRKLTAQPSAEQLRPGGVYLITGGLGQIGLILAEYLARSLKAKIALTSRSGLPSREAWEEWLAGHSENDSSSAKIRWIKSLEALGSTVLVFSADVTNEAQMRGAIEETVDRFGGLDGVIHAAGCSASETYVFAQNANQALCEALFAPKVFGLYVLDRVLQGRDVDFCFVFSSISTILGGLGLGTYAAANTFMDAYVQARNGTGGSRWISVNWDAWESQINNQVYGFKATIEEFAMTPEEGVKSFALAIASGVGRLIHSTRDLESLFRHWVLLESPTAETTGIGTNFARPALTTAYTPASDEYERRIAIIWQELLGIAEIGIHDNFFDLGGNSLIGLQLLSKLQKAFDQSIPATVLFEAPTVSRLAKYLRPAVPTDQNATLQKDILFERRRKTRQNAGNPGIAIIGMSGRFPNAKTVERFWENLCNGIETTTFFSDEELLAAGVDPLLLQKSEYVKARPMLADIDQFDASFFGYSPREAELLDPQHRIFLECTWEALELAGYDSERYGGLIGVFAGANIGLYALPRIIEVANQPQTADAFLQAVLSNDKDALTTTVSYKLNLRGPSFAVQTYCSTSLVAAHLACQSLRNGECDMALAGGVSILFLSKQGYMYQEGGQDSPDGHCRTFDAQASGTIFGDGVGVVVLKRLDDALADGDTIHAVIRGSAINNDGSLKVGYTAPSLVGQAEAISTALEYSDVQPDSIGYVEAHGTATALGDPVEIASLTRAFRKYTNRKCFCAIGSLKTNTGHLNQAAGVTGLIKTALVVKNGIIPASLHYEQRNPEIDFANSPFYVNTKLSAWPPSNDTPRQAGVNALGVGGTNAFAIVEEPPEPPRSSPSRAWQLIVIAARSTSALDQATANLADFLRQHQQVHLGDVAYTLQVGRRNFDYRRIAVCQSTADALQILESQDPRRLTSNYQTAIRRPLAFLLPGVGDHYLHMARDLYEQEALFRNIVEQCSHILYPYLGAHLRDLLYPTDEPYETGPAGDLGLCAMLGRKGDQRSPAGKKLNETRFAQPVVFVAEYALARLLMSWGIQPQVLLGYSLGEYVAACLAGVMSLPDALKLVAERARMIQSLPEGRMLAVALSADAVRPWLSSRVALAVRIGQQSCVVAGDPDGIARVEDRLLQEDIVCRALNATHAFHSPFLEPLKAGLTHLTRSVTLNEPRIPYLSNLTGDWITSAQATDPSYWAEQMCQPVCFYEALGVLLQDQDQILLEVGPGQAMGSFAKQHPRCKRAQVPLILPTLRAFHEHDADLSYLLGTLGKLWLLGVEPDWSGFYAGERRQRISLPTYPFERQRFWLESAQKAGTKQSTVHQERATEALDEAMRSLPRQELTNWFSLPAWKQVAPLLPQFAQHSKEKAWLLFADPCGVVSEQLRAWLDQNHQKAIVIMAGSVFERFSENHYRIRPKQREDYERLLTETKRRGVASLAIVHLWNVTPEETVSLDEELLDQTLAKGFYSVVSLVQAIKEIQFTMSEISIVSTHMQAVTSADRVCPEKATVLGPCRVIPLEYTNITCRSIDIVLPSQGDWRMEVLLSNLIGELTSPVAEQIVALRGHQRLVQTFEPVPLPPILENETPCLRSNGVYLITGGLGGIGLAVAEYLARKVRARLVLMGRSGLPPREQWAQIVAEQGVEKGLGYRIRRVQRLEELGAEVLVIQADVADEAQVRWAVLQSRARFGIIHGAIHTAGLPGAGLIQHKTPQITASVLAPKLKGTLVLERVLDGVELDFLVLFSSITSATGALGQIDYVAANSFLDAYASSHLGEKRLTVSIAWNEWQWNAWEAGLDGFQGEVQAFLRENRKRFGITFEEGVDAFHRILARRLAQVVVSPQDLRDFIEVTKSFTIEAVVNWRGSPHDKESKKYPRPNVGPLYVAPSNEVEERIAAVWRDTLGLEEVGIHDNFFDLGGNSLIGLELVGRLRKTLNSETIPMHILYEAPTVNALAKFAQQDHTEETSMITERLARGQERRQRLKDRRSHITTRR